MKGNVSIIIQENGDFNVKSSPAIDLPANAEQALQGQDITGFRRTGENSEVDVLDDTLHPVKKKFSPNETVQNANSRVSLEEKGFD